MCNSAITLRAARANEHACDFVLRGARNQTKHVSVVEDLDTRILADSTPHVQIEQRPRERQHFEFGWESDAPTGTREPCDFVRHVDDRRTGRDHFVLHTGEKFFDNLPSTNKQTM